VTGAVLGLVDRYLELGLRLGRHVDGLVDAYYGPADLARRVDAEAVMAPASLRDDARRLVADLDGGAEPDVAGQRRRWLRGQVVGLVTVAAKLAGEDISYSDEVEACYGVRPRWVDEDEIEAAHRRLDGSLAGEGPLFERLAAFRDEHAIPTDRLRAVIDDLADDFRERTDRMFGLPDGEHVDFELVHDRPWSGFNYYLGDLRSRVAINTDLPVLATAIGHLVAHEAYPGHHTEHSRKEAGLVRRAGHREEVIFLVGTPQCLMAEGLADLAIEVLLGDDKVRVVGEHLRAHRVRYDTEAVEAVTDMAEISSRARGNLGLLLHQQGATREEAVAWAERWLLLDRKRAEKSVEFLLDPTWRAYISCYVEGLPLCRSFVAGDPTRFERLLTEQLLPADLAA
jgi:hypothetical protein